MRIYVTGASGFTGVHFVDAAGRAGHEVLESAVDLLDESALASSIASFQPEAIVHLAAKSFVGHGDALDFYGVNVIGTENLLKAARQTDLPFRKVLIASSANIYGPSDRSPISEDQAPRPVNHYGFSKLAMELLVETFRGDFPVVVARPFNYTGPGQDIAFVIPKIVDHFARRQAVISLGNLDVKREFNDVRMVCQSYLRLLEADDEYLKVNICTGKPYSLMDVIDALKGLTGHDLRIEVNPAFVRANEIPELYGDPTLLNRTVGPAETIDLTETLKDMLAHQP